MSQKTVIVANVLDKYSNPVAELVQEACKYDSEILLVSGTRRINAKSIMGIMAFNPCEGMSVEIITNGQDELDALTAIENYLTCRR